MVLYSREVLAEPAPEQLETILYQDETIVVADKPHGMTVTPAGDHVARSLLHRLRERTGIEEIVPIHRLDKDTAGIVMFSVNPELRGAYHGLFAHNSVQREYVAIAPVTEFPDQTHWRVESRVERGEPWFRQETVDGPTNALTLIDLLGRSGDLGLFRLRPQTGKKHQLRIHMASIGFPILGERLYPDLREGQPHLPLQLLARRLSFVDPCTKLPRQFESQNRLQGMLNFKCEEAFAYRSEA
jgi:tRNA pseudouridine32 synthase/23S rRNA pseudouridine746 synthase